MTRRRFSAKALFARLAEFGHCCADCKGKVGGAFGLDWDHVIPLAMGGDDDLSNLQPLCRNCHRSKTATDKGHIAKADRMRQRASGIKRQAANKIPGSKGTGLRKRLNGEVVRVKE